MSGHRCEHCTQSHWNTHKNLGRWRELHTLLRPRSSGLQERVSGSRSHSQLGTQPDLEIRLSASKFPVLPLMTLPFISETQIWCRKIKTKLVLAQLNKEVTKRFEGLHSDRSSTSLENFRDSDSPLPSTTPQILTRRFPSQPNHNIWEN